MPRKSALQRSSTWRSVGSVVSGREGLVRGRSRSVESVGAAGEGGGSTLRSARSVQSVRSVTIHPRSVFLSVSGVSGDSSVTG